MILISSLLFIASPPLCEVSVGSLKLKGIALPGTSCLWIPLDSEGLRLNESAETVTADANGVIELFASPSTIWYSLDCNRTGYPDDPVGGSSFSSSSSILSSSSSSEGLSKDGSSVLHVPQVLMIAIVFFFAIRS